MSSINENNPIDNKYLSKLDNINFELVFIIGVNRSGTSILYKLLNKTDCFNVVTSYHIIKYDELMYNHINNLEKKSKKELDDFLGEKQSKRKIDELKLNSDFAEEYGFLLIKKNNSPMLSIKTVETFITFCKKIQFISENNKPILLKNPMDSANFLYIKSVFPKSKFIFIHRNPFRTLNSQIRAGRTLVKNKSEYLTLLSPSYKKIYENKLHLFYYKFFFSPFTNFRTTKVINRLTNYTNYYLENIESLEKKDYIFLRYEDLCEKPNFEMNEIIKFLKIKPQKNVDYSKYVKPRKITLLKELQKRERLIIRKMNPYFSRFKYLEDYSS